MVNEIWKPIKGYEGLFSISNKGNVKSLERHIKTKKGERFIREHLLKKVIHKNGYYFVNLYKNKKIKICSIHRLVAEAFIPEYSMDKQVHHINEDKSDNSVENLKVLSVMEHLNLHKQIYPITKTCVICGKKYNPDPTHRRKSQVCCMACRNKLLKICASKRKKPVIQLSINGDFIKEWDSARDCKNVTGFLESKIWECCNGSRKSHKGYKWVYKENYKKNEM